MTSQVLSVRVPEAWIPQLQNIAESQASDMSKVMKEAIAQYLGVHNPESIPSLQERVKRIEHRLDELMGLHNTTAMPRRTRLPLSHSHQALP